MTDSIIIVGMLAAIGLGLWGGFSNAGVYRRIGSAGSSLAICVGLAHFGWRPFFGGAHDVATYFGCVMLTFGVLSWLGFRVDKS